MEDLMNKITQYLKDHSSAILATLVLVSKAGLLGKVGSTVVQALAAAVSIG
jgi:hypothetical protein